MTDPDRRRSEAARTTKRRRPRWQWPRRSPLTVAPTQARRCDGWTIGPWWWPGLGAPAPRSLGGRSLEEERTVGHHRLARPEPRRDFVPVIDPAAQVHPPAGESAGG